MNESIKNDREKISVESLALEKSKEIIKAISLNPYIKTNEILRDSKSNEIINIEAEVELPQKTKHDIRKIEPLSVTVYTDNERLPAVHALRKDFPQVSHLNLTNYKYPKSLCLYSETYSELKEKWSSFSFLERIREWLSLTSKGKSHADDQPLEPLLQISEKALIISNKVIFDIKHVSKIRATEIKKDIIKLWKVIEEQTNEGEEYLIISIPGDPQVHGLINKIPNNLKELDDFLKTTETNLLEQIISNLKSWYDDFKDKRMFELPIIIVTLIPLKRKQEADPEHIDIKAFITKNTLKEIGEELGIWQLIEGEYGRIIGEENSHPVNVELEMLNVIQEYSKENACLINRNENEKDTKITQIGVGALGSQIYNNLVRQGLGVWYLIDFDFFVPHNIARHILTKRDIGKDKVESIKEMTEELYAENVISGSSNKSILQIEKESESEEKENLDQSDLIIDSSASIPVARALTHDLETKGRIVSCFYSPSGKDSVVISEGMDKENKIDSIEMQYYRELIQNEELRNHLLLKEKMIRYGESCRDLSMVLPIESVTLHGSLITKELKKIIRSKKPSITIFKTNEYFEVKRYTVEVAKEYRKNGKEWSLVFDEKFLDKIKKLREEKLPRETGGILIGNYDRYRKIIYVVDTIPSPKDSHEWPTVYIRGIAGIRKKIEEVTERTGGMLEYIGEWHSHPNGSRALPSSDDIKAFEWLSEAMNESGLVALMMIAADNEQNFFVGSISEE